MTIPVSCPNCGKVLHAKDSAAGKKAKCPDCGDIIKIPELDDLDEAEDAYDAEEVDSGGDDYGDMDFGDEEAKMPKTTARKPCPACGEMIVKGAAKCRYCGEILDPKLKKLEKKRVSRSRGSSSYGDDNLSGLEWVIVILCPGIGCIAGIIYMIQGNPKGGKVLGISLLVILISGAVRAFITMAQMQGP